MQHVLDLLNDNWLLRIAVLLIVLFLAQMIIHHFSYVVIHRLVQGKNFSSRRAEKQREETLVNVVNGATGSLVWIVGICLILGQLNFNWGGLLAGAGVIGLVVGFGAQKVFGDFLSGFFILLENQFGVGDIVEVQGMAYGVVEGVYLRTTHIRNLDGGLHIIANSEIVNMANHSYGKATALIYQWLHYEADIDKAKELINKVGVELSQDETWKKEVRTPISFDRVEEYGADGVKVRATGDTEPGMQWAVAGEFRKRLKTEFDKAGIKPAYPRRVMMSGE